VYLQELNDDLREHFHFKGDGVLITGVITGTGAEKAGLEDEDIITAINDQKTTGIGDIKRVIADTDPGQEINLTFIRRGKENTVRVLLTEKKTASVRSPRKWIYYTGDDRPWMGIRFQDLNPQMADYFEVKSGMLVTEVLEDSPAKAAKLKAGDVITAWNTQDINGTDDFYTQLDRSNPGDEIQLTISRKGKKKSIKLTLAEPEKDSNGLFGFYIDKDNPDDYIFRFRKPHFQNFPFFERSNSSDSDSEEPADSKLDALEKEVGILKEKMEQLINQMGK